jgi:Predicted transcriptional regulator
LVVLAVFRDDKLTSERLALSAGCNPVVVRNTLGRLKKAGLIDIHRGTGGAVLIADPADVSVWTVFQAVDSLDDLIGMHPSPSLRCPVGEVIGDLLRKPYGMVAEAVREAMRAYTLKQLVADYRATGKHREVVFPDPVL